MYVFYHAFGMCQDYKEKNIKDADGFAFRLMLARPERPSVAGDNE